MLYMKALIVRFVILKVHQIQGAHDLLRPWGVQCAGEGNTYPSPFLTLQRLRCFDLKLYTLLPL